MERTGLIIRDMGTSHHKKLHITTILVHHTIVTTHQGVDQWYCLLGSPPCHECYYQ